MVQKRPIFTPGVAKRESSDAIARSQLATSWHPVYDDDPEHAYLRDLVVRAAELAVGPAREGDIEVVDSGSQRK